MISEAIKLQQKIKVNRTQASNIDTITGALGEFSFAEWFLGDWKKHEVGNNSGQVDFDDCIEIKTSTFPFRESLNLLVRQDYAIKRQPAFYIQVIIDSNARSLSEITPGTSAIIAGFATGHQVEHAPLKDFGSKFGGKGGYKCHFIEISKLHRMTEFQDQYQQYKLNSKKHSP